MAISDLPPKLFFPKPAIILPAPKEVLNQQKNLLNGFAFGTVIPWTFPGFQEASSPSTATITITAEDVWLFNDSNKEFNLSIGSADPDRRVLVGVEIKGSIVGTGEITSVTINEAEMGQKASLQFTDGDGRTYHYAFYLSTNNIATGTSANIRVWANSAVTYGIQAFRVVGLNSTTPIDTGSNFRTSGSADLTTSLDVVSGGFAVGIYRGDNSGGSSIGWSGLTEVSQYVFTDRFSAATLHPANNNTINPTISVSLSSQIACGMLCLSMR